MKKVITITAMLLIALGMNAQSNNSRTRTTGSSEEKKATTTTTQSRSSETRTSKATPTERTRTEETRSTTRTSSPGTVSSRPGNSQSRTVSPSNNSGNGRSSTYHGSTPDRSGTSTRTTTTTRTTEVKREGTRTNSGSGNTYHPGGDRRSPSSTSPRTVENNRSSQSVRGTSYDPKDGQVYVEKRRVYTTPVEHRVVRTAPRTTYVYHPIEYRRVHRPYYMPPRVEIIWDYNMYNHYHYLYPEYNLWYYPYGYRINTVSAYDVSRYIGELVRVYGIVDEVFYARESDEYYLYFGGPYPYNDFTVIMSGRDARKFSRRPVQYFAGRNVAATGLVSLYDGKPEMVVKRRSQVDVY